jgi:hypothetical protein
MYNTSTPVVRLSYNDNVLWICLIIKQKGRFAYPGLFCLRKRLRSTNAIRMYEELQNTKNYKMLQKKALSTCPLL